MTVFKTILLCASSLGFLTACGATSTDKSLSQVSNSKIDAALERVVSQSSQQGSLPFLETLYKRNSNDPETAISYAEGLRKTNDARKAALIVAQFALQKTSPSSTKSEYAAIQLELGNYLVAAEFAQKAIQQNKDDFKAYHYLGVAQDARGMHKEAEMSFNKALENWQGDIVPVLNNLALNLATQKRIVEASEMITRAAILAPHRQDIEDNRRVIATLQSSYKDPAPAPYKKPS